MKPMAITRDHDDEHAARIDQLLEQLRLSTENLHELAKQAVDRARAACRAAERTVEKLQAQNPPQDAKGPCRTISAEKNLVHRRSNKC
jgi:cob(I)alamin adenosyltransferase